MRALIFSDSHGDEANLRWMAELAAQRGPMDAYIHCGDGARDFDRLANFLLGLSPQAALYGVKGNCDLGVDAPVQRVVHLGGMGILITHGHLQAVKLTLGVLAPAAREAGCGVVLFGHTHRPTLEERDGILLLNPGTAQRGYAALLQVDAAGHAQGELLSF